MNRFRASLTVAALVAASLSLSGPAEGGGPTSALLSVPGAGKTASLYYTDPEYDALADLVGVNGDSGTVDRSGSNHASGPGVTVTWLIHDVMPWRVDHIYLDSKGGPWIGTQSSSEAGTIWESPVVWHQSSSPKELDALLDKLGVGAASRAAGDFSGVAGAPAPAPAEPEPELALAPAPDQPAADASSLAGIWWGLGGLAVGILLTVVWVRRSRADADPSSEPGIEPADKSGVMVSEELSWPASRA